MKPERQLDFMGMHGQPCDCRHPCQAIVQMLQRVAVAMVFGVSPTQRAIQGLIGRLDAKAAPHRLPLLKAWHRDAGKSGSLEIDWQ